jgi:hypothetical protein
MEGLCSKHLSFLCIFLVVYLFTPHYFEETTYTPTPMFEICKHESNLFVQNRIFCHKLHVSNLFLIYNQTNVNMQIKILSKIYNF